MFAPADDLITLARPLAIAAAAAVLAMSSACSPWIQEEVDRRPSPDSMVDAVVVRADAGATTSFVHKIYIVAPGDSAPESGRAALVADKVHGLELTWVGPKHLRIAYEQAQIHQYRNHIILRHLPGPAYDVFVEVIRANDSAGLPEN